MKTKPLIITTGEPAGIGMDIVLMLAEKNKLWQTTQPIVILANIQALIKRMQLLINKNCLSQSIMIEKISIDNLSNIDNLQKKLWVIDIEIQDNVEAGTLNPKNANMVLQQLQIAHQLAINQQVSAIITAPLQKSVIMQIQPDFMGHTEYFMQQSGLDKVVMMLANAKMKVALVTTHLPLKAVAQAITTNAIRQTVDIVLHDLKTKFGLENPKILVCGLNPHAGENGHLGDEEIHIINPVLQQYQQQGINISLAMPADTLFTPRHMTNCDAIIAMYHDQGLAPLKSHGFGETVNITLGLPYIRTSVDHGTALDLAGTGQGNPDSLYHAIQLASQMANHSPQQYSG